MKFILLLLTLFSLLFSSEALEAFKAKKYDLAYKLYLQEAAKGDEKALYALSYLYFNALGTTKDVAKGLKAITQSANKGYVVAQYNLGMFYLIGNPLEQNYTKAAKWLTLAADNNQSDAAYNLALLYINGDGVKPNTTTALTYMKKAVALKHPRAKENMGRFLVQLLKFEEAIPYLQADFARGDREAAYLLEQIYLQLQRPDEAKKWANKKVSR